jgi:D-2-hydroxyacid dehydrogenase (NADP+)
VVGVFTTDAVWDEIGERLVAIDPSTTLVRYVPGEHVDDAEAARIDVAFLSHDLLPRWAGSYLKVCLESPTTRWLHSLSAGVDHPVFRAIIDRGIRLTNSSGAAGPAIAHHVIMSLLALRRDLAGFLRDQSERAWRPRDLDDVEGTTVAVIGMGPIGEETARLAAAFGMRPIGVRRVVRGDEPCETWTFDRLHELLPIADAIVLAVPLTDDTRSLLDSAALGRLRPGCHLVNVGRGELVDEEALIDALRTGQVGAAALDVTTVEPLPEDSPLWSMPNVVITPHTSGATTSTRRRVHDMFVAEFGHFVRGEPFEREIR